MRGPRRAAQGHQVRRPATDARRRGRRHALRQEFEAFQQIKAIRHPFLLQLERVELVAGELVMVMELADSQLQDRFDECRARGLPGIPRDELLGYLADAAEALDVIGAKHGLQHLDIKPANLFLIAGHVKVGDYGLVARLEAGGRRPPDEHRGLTPRYVAPEVLRGRIDPRSDQYSLALVYQELLTGTFPYPGRTAAQLMLQHVTAAPDLAGLPEADRGPVARALPKNPADRFPSCMAFVQALMSAGLPRVGSDTPAADGHGRGPDASVPGGPVGRRAEALPADVPAAPAPGTAGPGDAADARPAAAGIDHRKAGRRRHPPRPVAPAADHAGPAAVGLAARRRPPRGPPGRPTRSS